MTEPGSPSNAAAVADGERRLPETVCFALKARADYKKNKEYLAAKKLTGRFRITGVLVGLVIVWFAIVRIAAIKFGTWDFLLSLAVLTLPLVLWPIISTRRFGRIYGSRLPLVPPEGHRLCCIGAPEQLAEFGEWADVPFEPALFFGKFVIRGRGRSRWLYAAIAGISFLVILGFGIRWFGGRFVGQFPMAISVALGIAEAATAFLWPTYLRLVPGRLEVLSYGPLSRKPLFFHRYDLRDAEITADLRRSFVSIVSPRGRLEFGIALMRERRHFVYTLFLAALSTFEPGPTPEDDLTG